MTSIVPFLMAPQVRSLHSPPTLIVGIFIEMAPLASLMDGALMMKRHFVIFKFKCVVDTICHEGKLLYPLKHLIPLKKPSCFMALTWHYYLCVTIKLLYHLKYA